jgi:hypothetical protein
MSMTAQTQAEYAPGGWRYNNLAKTYGTGAANAAAEIAADGGEQWEISEALNRYRPQYADPGSESTLGNFFQQITTDPLAAPLESANNQLGNIVAGVFRNPWVLIAVVLVIFHLLGGFDYVKRRIARA